jgi:hypothetical protein
MVQVDCSPRTPRPACALAQLGNSPIARMLQPLHQTTLLKPDDRANPLPHQNANFVVVITLLSCRPYWRRSGKRPSNQKGNPCFLNGRFAGETGGIRH